MEHIFLKRLGLLLALLAILFGFSMGPLFLDSKYITLYYGSFFFTVLIACVAILLFFLASFSSSEHKEWDSRITVYGLRIALAFGIGAVLVAVILMIAIFNFSR